MGFCCCIPVGLQDKEAGMISDGFDEGTVRYLGKRYWHDRHRPWKLPGLLENLMNSRKSWNSIDKRSAIYERVHKLVDRRT